MDFKDVAKQLRQGAGVSQEEVARAIGIARATYANLETGRREPNLSEITNLAEYYQVSPSDLISGKLSVVEEPVTAYKFNEIKVDKFTKELEMKFKAEKLREVLLYILDKIGAKPNIGETALYKLLYFIDFDYYEKTGQSITGLKYIHNHYGPTPATDFAKVVKGMVEAKELEIVETEFFNNTQRKYLPTVSTELNCLSGNELNHINEELDRLGDKNAKELTELSHYDTPWLVAKQSQEISYRDVFYRTTVTAVTQPEDEL